ncbi:MAG: hypothetical protein SVY10_15835 [Thermodesulfobacteriota bacterium]|nr:hypothetical protein [Thermodesulfobacteriota bacterium]
MTHEELRAIMVYLAERVHLSSQGAESPVVITFDAPTEKDMIEAGLDAEGGKRILRVPWWEEMVTDIVETPDMCDPDDSPQQILEFAKDVVSEYIRKRIPLNGDSI